MENDENNNNNFNFVNDNKTFKKSSAKKYSSGGGFGKSVLVPFVSGVLGATLVVGTCFGVPGIRSRLITQSNKSNLTISNSTETNNVMNLADYSNTSTAVAEKVLPSVVGITVSYQVNSFFGSQEAEATGSGIIISEDGYILTNNHVVESESSSSYYTVSSATKITINLYNSTETYEATIVGTDSYTDLAVLKIDATGLTPATLGNSDNLKVGEFVMAIGNPVGMDYSVTTGVVSALNREVESDGVTYTAIQTDAAINSGNSGGALVNADGEVIGINTLKLSGSGIEGIGFAIPISQTTSVIEQLIDHNSVKRPYIGISASDVSEDTAKRYNVPVGVYVESVEENSSAQKAGIQQGDIITKINDTDVSTVTEFNKIKYTYNIGDKVTLTVYRNNEYITVEVELIEQPEEDTSTTKSTDANSNNNNGSYYYYYGNGDNGSGSNGGSGSIFDFFNF